MTFDEGEGESGYRVVNKYSLIYRSRRRGGFSLLYLSNSTLLSGCAHGGAAPHQSLTVSTRQSEAMLKRSDFTMDADVLSALESPRSMSGESIWMGRGRRVGPRKGGPQGRQRWLS